MNYYGYTLEYNANLEYPFYWTKDGDRVFLSYKVDQNISGYYNGFGDKETAINALEDNLSEKEKYDWEFSNKLKEIIK